MARTAEQLRADALRIWQAGLAAVSPQRLIFDAVHINGSQLIMGDEELELDSTDRIVVVGGGKAAAAMASGLEQALGPEVLASKELRGWINVPAGSEVPTDRITVHTSRPAGLNEPTAEGAAGVARMLELVGALGSRDLCIALISGGGSALMPAPIEGFALDDKLALTRELSARGATIAELNAVRSALSRFKGGGLARACRAGRLVSLVLSDVPGDDLATIASGPTALRPASVEMALDVLRRLQLDGLPAGRRAVELLKRRASEPTTGDDAAHLCRVTNFVVGNNATAVDAAGIEAERLGYSHAMISASEPEGDVHDVAHQLTQTAKQMRVSAGPDCLISGGEPTVQLAPEGVRGRGGRNQQLCLAALAEIEDWRGLALLSGGTDGEDGPTDAAGACVDAGIAAEAARLQLNPREFLTRNDAYSFFSQAGGLLKTGATHTNVGDVRVVVVAR